MGATVYIHIGVHKTGTTSIQQTMYRNHPVLLAHGINYLPVERNHGFLISLLSDTPHERPNNIRRYLDTPEKAASFNASNRDRLMKMLQENRSPKILISSEGLSTISNDEVARLKAMFDPYASAYRIIVYVREPYEFINSAALQRLKNGLTLANPGPLPMPHYRQKIRKYIRVFGRETIDIRIFDPQHFAGGSLVGDFLTALGEFSPELEKSLELMRANQSMSHEGAMILSEANEAIPTRVGGRANRARAFAFHVPLADIKGEKFAIEPDVYRVREDEVVEDIAWLHRAIGKKVFQRPMPRPASTGRWSEATVESIKIMVADMVSTIRKLRAPRRPGIWQSLFGKGKNANWRFREKKDFSQAVDAELKEIALPPELAWLREAIGQLGAAPAAPPRFDQPTVRALACFIHGLALTIEKLKNEQASQQRRLFG